MTARWSCAAAYPGSPLPLGALVTFRTPTPERPAPAASVPAPPPDYTAAARCTACGATLVPDFESASCVFCHETLDNGSAGPKPRAVPMSGSSSASVCVVDYSVPAGSDEHPVSRMRSSISENRGFMQDTIFVVDRSIAKGELETLRRAIISTLGHLPPSALVGLVVAGAAVSVYELGQHNPSRACATADFFSSTSPLDNIESELIHNHELSAQSCFLASASSVKGSIDCVLSTLVACSRGNAAKLRRRARLKRLRARRKSGKPKVSSAERKEPGNNLFEDGILSGGAPPARSIFKAVEVSCALLKAQHCYGGHVIIFASGPETSAAATSRKDIGRLISNADVVVSTFLASSGLVDVSGFDALMPGPPSSIILHSSFDDETFPENLLRAVHRVTNLETGPVPSNCGNVLTKNMSVRCSAGIRLVQVIGAATAGRTNIHEKHSEDNMTALAVSTRGGSIALYFELDETENLIRSDKSVYVQITMEEVLTSNQVDTERHHSVIRVVTKRFDLAKDKSANLASLDPQIAAVILAKLASLSSDESEHLDNSEMAEANVSGTTKRRSSVTTMDARFFEILRSLVQWVYTFRDSLTKVPRFPSELEMIARVFYHARCSPLCNVHLYHNDEIALARMRLRFASQSEAIRMMTPELWMLPASELISASNKASLDIPSLFKEVPLSSMSLRSDSILVLDSEAQTIIWSGAMMAGVEFDSVRSQVRGEWEKITQQRFPKPHVIMAVQGSLEERSLLAFLEPSHNDSPFVQLKSVPGLGSMSDSDLNRLRGNLPHSEGSTFSDYMRSCA
eukprot:g4857.t1